MPQPFTWEASTRKSWLSLAGLAEKNRSGNTKHHLVQALPGTRFAWWLPTNSVNQKYVLGYIDI